MFSSVPVRSFLYYNGCRVSDNAVFAFFSSLFPCPIASKTVYSYCVNGNPITSEVFNLSQQVEPYTQAGNLGHQTPAPHAQPLVGPDSTSRENFTILLVDDDSNMLLTIKHALTKLGYRVLTATDGSQAVDTFRQYSDNIHLVLCDLFMPCMDGWETLAAMRKISPKLPFILSSGYGAARALAGQQAEPIQAFLSKPYVLNDLRHTWLAC